MHVRLIRLATPTLFTDLRFWLRVYIWIQNARPLSPLCYSVSGKFRIYWRNNTPNPGYYINTYCRVRLRSSLLVSNQAFYESTLLVCEYNFCPGKAPKMAMVRN